MDIENAIQVLSNVGKKMTDDTVNHPLHYTSHPSGVECATIAEHYGFCIGNAIKYLWRHGLKPEHFVDTSNKAAITDLKKAVWYIEKEIDRLERFNENQLEMLNETQVEILPEHRDVSDF